MALTLTNDWCVNGGTAETSVTSPSFTPPNGSIICVRGSCFAGSGDDTSTIAISDTAGLTWNTRVIISQLTDGAGTIPPPIAIWTAEVVTGVSMTVTTSIVDGVGFAHFQAGRIYSGQHAVTPVVDTDEVQSMAGAATANLTAPVDGCVAFAGMCDWGNTADVPTGQVGTTDQCAIANADVQSSWAGFIEGVPTGAVSIGTQALATTEGTNLVAILLQPAEEEAVTGVLDVVLPVPTVDMAGEVTAAGTLAITLPVPDAEFDGEATAAGVLGIDLPLPDASFTGELSAAGTLEVTLPVPVVAFDGEVSVGGQLDLVLPVPNVNLDGELPVSGVLNIDLPVPQVEFQGNSAAGGTIMGPCGWTIPDPLCCDSWATTPANIQAAARDYAALILWAATGQQFGLCQVTVRPCGSSKCGDGLFNFFGFSWGSGTWTPYIFQGQWFNCMCWGSCCCEPRCQVRLMGDVADIIEVTIGGIAVDPSAYRVDDGHWLVRTDGDCWPECPDMNTADGDNVFEVTYLRGDPVPPALLNAAAILACEWAKACQGADCRLSSRVTSISRSGIDINMVDPSVLLDNGMTGLWEVDNVIKALNPYGRKQRGRIYAPELNVPRMQTS